MKNISDDKTIPIKCRQIKHGKHYQSLNGIGAQSILTPKNYTF